MVVQRLWSRASLRGFLDPRWFRVVAQESAGDQDPSLGIHKHQSHGNISTLASLDTGEDSLIFLGKGIDRDIVCLVGFPPLCYGVCSGLGID